MNLPVEPMSLLGLLAFIVTSLIAAIKVFTSWFLKREDTREAVITKAAQAAQEQLVQLLKSQVEQIQKELQVAQRIIMETIADKHAIALRLHSVEKELDLIRKHCIQCPLIKTPIQDHTTREHSSNV